MFLIGCCESVHRCLFCSVNVHGLRSRMPSLAVRIFFLRARYCHGGWDFSHTKTLSHRCHLGRAVLILGWRKYKCRVWGAVLWRDSGAASTETNRNIGRGSVYFHSRYPGEQHSQGVVPRLGAPSQLHAVWSMYAVLDSRSKHRCVDDVFARSLGHIRLSKGSNASLPAEGNGGGQNNGGPLTYFGNCPTAVCRGEPTSSSFRPKS